MNLIRKYILTLIILGTVTEGYSQDTTTVLKLSITDAQEYALEYNRMVKAARIDVDIATKKVKETVAIGLPQLTLAGNYQHQFVVPELSFGPYLDINSLPDAGFLTKADFENAYKPSPPVSLGVKNNTTFDITLSQLIFSGEYFVGLQALKIYRVVAEQALVKTEGETKEAVASTYYLVLVLGESIRVLEESMASLDKTYNDMVKMNQQGFNEETDVDQININISNVKRLIASVKTQRDISFKLLKYQLGMDFNQNIELTDSIHYIIQEGNLQYLASPDFNVKSSIDYQIVSNQQDISEVLLKREQAKMLPTVAGFYRRHEQTNQPSFNFQVKDLIGVSLNFPIFTSGMRQATISQARLNLDKSRVTTENVGQGLIMEFESALSSYQTAYSNFITNSESIVLSNKVYERTVIKYQQGVSTSFELAQNQNQYLTAESNYYTSVLTLLNAKAKLDRILSSY